MEKFTTLRGVAAPLPMVNVDTDMIIPKQFLKTIKRTGLKEGLFYEMRWTADGQKKDFILDQPAYQNAKILVAGPNFGCGSSREHAPWALLDFGIRCIISEDFADIFYNNCFKNGVLPIKMPKEIIDKLMDDASRGSNAIIEVDLEKQEIKGPDGGTVHFDIDPFRKHCLLNGLDDIGLTMEKKSEIDDFEARQKERSPGCTPHPDTRPLAQEKEDNGVQPQSAGAARRRHRPRSHERSAQDHRLDGQEARGRLRHQGRRGRRRRPRQARRAAHRRHHEDGARGRRRAVRLGRRAEVGQCRVQQEARARPACACARRWTSSPTCARPRCSTRWSMRARSSPRSSRVSTS